MEVFTSVPKLRVWERTCKVEALLRGGAAGLEVFRVAAIHDSQTDPASCALLADGWDSYAVSVVAQFETVPEGPQKLAGGAAQRNHRMIRGKPNPPRTGREKR
jgi:hypothetical protein